MLIHVIPAQYNTINEYVGDIGVDNLINCIASSVYEDFIEKYGSQINISKIDFIRRMCKAYNLEIKVVKYYKKCVRIFVKK